MRTLQEKMDGMKPYFRGIDVYNDALMVKVTFPNTWKCYPSEDERIKVAPSEDGSDVIYYYADSNDTSYDDMFDFIEETIKANQEITLKLVLLKQKVEELKELFSNTPYEELKNLKFTLEADKTTKSKRKYAKKAKAAEKEKEEPVLENNDNDEVNENV